MPSPCRGVLPKLGGTILLLLAAVSPLRAQVYNNGLPNAFGGVEMTGWVEADDFTLAAATTLTAVRFWASFSNVSAYQGSIFWQIFSNAAGSPGASLAGGLASPVTSPGTPPPCCGETSLQFDFGIGNQSLSAGVYWLALHNGPLTTATVENFSWQITDPNVSFFSKADVAPFDGSWSDNGIQLAYQLYETTSVVPEPATLGLLATGLVGLAGVGLLRRRRRRA